jgi:hypothetical protein
MRPDGTDRTHQSRGGFPVDPAHGHGRLELRLASRQSQRYGVPVAMRGGTQVRRARGRRPLESTSPRHRRRPRLRCRAVATYCPHTPRRTAPCDIQSRKYGDYDRTGCGGLDRPVAKRASRAGPDSCHHQHDSAHDPRATPRPFPHRCGGQAAGAAASGRLNVVAVSRCDGHGLRDRLRYGFRRRVTVGEAVAAHE